MTPIFFGPKDGQLYGVYHPASGNTYREYCVLLCYPFGQEYMRAHRAFRILATEISELGFDVLRFDYFGTGDSAGSGEQATAERWQEDILEAVREICEISGRQRVIVIGLRIGALLAASVSGQIVPAPALVMWDPIVSGEDFIEEARQLISSKSGAGHAGLNQDSMWNLNGFPLGKELRHEMEKLRIDIDSLIDKATGLAVFSSTVREFIGALRDNESRCHFQLIPSDGNWNYVDHVGGILLPQPIISAIVQFLDSWEIR